MASKRFSELQRRILAWLAAEEQRTCGTTTASYIDLARALGHHEGNLSYSVANLEAKGFIRVVRTSGGKAKSINFTSEGRNRVKQFPEVLIKEHKVLIKGNLHGGIPEPCLNALPYRCYPWQLPSRDRRLKGCLGEL
jgi:DNA-binding MarR family transcriptional regulator